MRNANIQYYRSVYLMDGRYDVPSPGFANLKTNLQYNAPRLATAMLSRHYPYVNRPVRVSTDKEREKSSRLEHLVLAGIRQSDKLSVARGHDLFRHELPQGLLIDGWAYVEDLLDLNGKFNHTFCQIIHTN